MMISRDVDFLGLGLALTTYLSYSLPIVAGHGFVQNVAANGQNFPGWNPFNDPYASPIPERIVRKIPSDGPITNVDDPNLACNQGGENGTPILGNATAGTQVVFEWTNWPADHLGPVSTYMTSCNGACSTFDVNGAKWFKVDAGGYDGSLWASAKLIADNNSWTSTIPAALAPGQYLMRNEIVALHSTGQPQFYPSCSQVQVDGTGASQPAEQDLITIPGLYDDVQWPDIWTNFGSFTIPGPPPAFGNTSSDPSSASNFTAAVSSTAGSGGTSTGLGDAASKSASPIPSTSQPPDTVQCRRTAAHTFSKRHGLIRRGH